MKISMVSAEYPPMQGGVGDCTRELARALLAMGHQVNVITSRKVAGLAGLEPETGAEPTLMPVVKRWNWGSWKSVNQALQLERPDIVHIQYQTAAYAMHPAINLLPLWLHTIDRHRAVVTTLHDLRVPYLCPKAGMLRTWVTNALPRWSDATVTTNVEDYRRLEASHWQGSVPRGNIHLVPIGSNIRPLKPAGFDRGAWRRDMGLAEDELLLCYFGFLNESKGAETLLRSLAELRHRERRAKLVMIGGQLGDSDPTNEAYAKRVHELGEELGIADLVLWTGYTDGVDVTANLLAADICVLPYRDGVSFRRGSFMAALAHGLPIVSTSPRGSSDELVDGKNILLVAPDDVGGIADAVEKLADDVELKMSLAEGALQLAARFTWEHIAQQTVQVYEMLVRNKSRERAQS
jgi:glycosyltransferase involved in cell wall biosynthesis